MNKQFDQMDHQIIQALHKDARLSASEIARSLNANERTIRKRIERLVRLGAVRLTAIIDPEAFGYLTAVDIFLEVDADKEDEVIQRFLTMPEISYIAFGEGTKDLSIECRFKTNAGWQHHGQHDTARVSAQEAPCHRRSANPGIFAGAANSAQYRRVDAQR